MCNVDESRLPNRMKQVARYTIAAGIMLPTAFFLSVASSDAMELRR